MQDGPDEMISEPKKIAANYISCSSSVSLGHM